MNVWLLALELTVPIVFLVGTLYLIWIADWLPRRFIPSNPASPKRRRIGKLTSPKQTPNMLASDNGMFS